MAPVYEYVAIDARGRRHTGVEQAASSQAVANAVQARGLFLLKLHEGNDNRRQALDLVRFGTRRQVLGLTRSLSSLLGAGLSMRRALAVAEHTVHEPILSILRTIRGRVERGDSLADALAAHPRLFPPVYVGLIRAGERSADVSGSFAKLAQHLERDEEFRSRIVSASIYPCLLAGIGGTAVMLLVLFVLPRFADMLQGAGATLPRSTAAMLWLGRSARTGWPVALSGGSILLALLVWQRTSVRGQQSLSRLLLRLPVVSRIRRDALTARFARVLGVLIAGGAPVLNALAATAESIPDALSRTHVNTIRQRVREGEPLYAAISGTGFFSPVLTELVAVGEESGRFDAFLMKAAEILEREVERTMQRLTTLAEPAMIVLFGVMIGFVALSLLKAIYGLNVEPT